MLNINRLTQQTVQIDLASFGLLVQRFQRMRKRRPKTLGVGFVKCEITFSYVIDNVIS